MLSQPVENALLVPQKAIFDILDRRYVFVVDDENTVHLREIVVGQELPHLSIVEHGLSEADRILLEGLRKVRDGQEIHVEERPTDVVVAELDLPAE